MTLEQLHKLRETLTEHYSIEELTDIKDIRINTSVDCDKRIINFLDSIKNPYFFRCGEVGIKIHFSGTKKLDSIILQLLITKNNS